MEKIEEKEQPETLLKELIEKVEKDDLPTNVFDVEDTDPLVLLGKMNEIIKNLKLFTQLVSENDEQSTEALEKAVKALTQAGEALEKSIEAETLAQQGNETANKALDKAEVADSTAIEAINDATEALSKANEALEAVAQRQGTKVFDNQGNLLSNAHFTGHNGINIDMSENNPETFDIQLDNTTTQTIEESKQRLDQNDADIVEITKMLSATEELAQKADDDISNTINPKLEELEDKKVSKSFLDYNGNLVIIETSSDEGFSVRTYKGTAPNVQNLTGILSIGSTNTIIANYDGQGNLKGRLKIDTNGILSYNDIPVSLNYAWQSINIASTAKSAGDHSIDLATFLPNWIDGAEYEVVVVIEAYELETSYMQTSTDMFENSRSDQRFSTNGRQGGGIYTLPIKRYLKWHINSKISTLYINIRAIRRTR